MRLSDVAKTKLAEIDGLIKEEKYLEAVNLLDEMLGNIKPQKRDDFINLLSKEEREVYAQTYFHLIPIYFDGQGNLFVKRYINAAVNEVMPHAMQSLLASLRLRNQLFLPIQHECLSLMLESIFDYVAQTKNLTGLFQQITDRLMQLMLTHHDANLHWFARQIDHYAGQFEIEKSDEWKAWVNNTTNLAKQQPSNRFTVFTTKKNINAVNKIETLLNANKYDEAHTFFKDSVIKLRSGQSWGDLGKKYGSESRFLRAGIAHLFATIAASQNSETKNGEWPLGNYRNAKQSFDMIGRHHFIGPLIGADVMNNFERQLTLCVAAPQKIMPG